MRAAAATPGPGGRPGALAWRGVPPGRPPGEGDARPPLLVAEDLLARGVVAAFTGRRGGTSAPPYAELNLGLRVGDEPRRVLANRRGVLAALGLAGRPVATLRQVHGAEVVSATLAALGGGPPEARPPLADADGVVSSQPAGPVLLVLVADCVPVLLADPAGRVVAALHAGWRGLAAGVVEVGVAALRAHGGDPARTVALVGPCIGPQAYEVGADVRARVAARYPAAAAVTRRGAPALDLAAAARAALEGAGVAEVRSAAECTHDLPERYFSHRRDGDRGRAATGRQGGLIALLGGDGPKVGP